MDVKIKDLGDAVNQLTQIENTIADIANLLQLQKTMVTTSAKKKLQTLAETFTFPKGDLDSKPITPIDLNKAKALKIQKGLENLISDYRLMDMLVDLEAQVKDIETAIKLGFSDALEVPEVLAQIEGIKTKLKVQKQSVIAFLNELSKGALPPSFSKFVFTLTQALSKNLALTEDQSKVSYTLSAFNDSLLYAAYIELRKIERDVPSDENDLISKVYLVLLWYLEPTSNHSDVRFALSYELVPAEELFESGIKLLSTSDTLAVLDSILRGERFKISNEKAPQGLKGKIKELNVEPEQIIVTVYSMKEPSLQTNLYKSIPKLFGIGAKFNGVVSGNKMTFDLIARGEVKPYTNDQVAEFQTWGLSYEQIKKIETILMS